MNPLEIFSRSDVAASTRLVLAADVLSLIGVFACAISIWLRTRSLRAGGQLSGGARLLVHTPFTLLLAGLVVMGFAVGFRWIEVNHFPSQTMSEVLTMFTSALFVSMVVLRYALGLSKKSTGYGILEDVLIGLVFVGVAATHAYVRTLSTAQRDLPPALQSYWFAPHLSCLIFSYATMGIAALIAIGYFVLRFWSSIFTEPTMTVPQRWTLGLASLSPALLLLLVREPIGVSPIVVFVAVPLAGILGYFLAKWVASASGSTWRPRPEWAILIGFTCVPFVQAVTWPLLIVGGIAITIMHLRGNAPRVTSVLALEKSLDDVSFRAFAVGFPFLTAGLWMGAFWAQEAWANYWGWDSKENSALITWLVYVVYVHLRMLGGYRGAKAMGVLVAGALSVFLTFQIFGYLPDSQKSLHRYTDDGVEPREGQQGPAPSTEQARADVESR